MGKKNPREKIVLTDSLNEKLDNSTPDDATSLYAPVKRAEKNFADLVGEEEYYSELFDKTRGKKNNKSTIILIGVILGITIIGCLSFLFLLFKK